MEILQDNELQAILGRNDILGENLCTTPVPGKSACVVRGRESSCGKVQAKEKFPSKV